MNIVFKVDSSIQMGIGHLMRCLTLADELQKINHQIIFICRELAGNLIGLVKQKYQVIVLSVDDDFKSGDLYLDWLGSTQDQDALQTIAVIPKNTDLLVIDSYALDNKWHKKLRPYTKKIMVIDDLANREFDCNILLNQNLGSQKEDYKNKVPNDCQLLLGCEYALLRPEFLRFRNKALKKRRETQEIKNILISVGGSDPKNITYDVLQHIGVKLNVVVILGGSSPHNEMIKDYSQGKNIKVIVEADNMAKLMLNADLAIGAGGSTSWERCCLGLPTLLFVAAENQQRIAKNLEQLGAGKIVKDFKQDFKALINDFSLWQEMSGKAKNICDGLGSNRVIENVK